MSAGYSRRTLVEKLGIKPGYRIALFNAPSGYEVTLGPLPENVITVNSGAHDLDLVQFFSASRDELERRFEMLAALIKSNGMLWIAWPKGASKIPTDLNENIIREIGLATGLVDVKVIAVDEQWSGLKFVYRLKDRK
jgi:hypothetical protein